MFIARNKGLKEVADVKSIHIPPLVLLVDGKQMGCFRIYCDEERRLLLVVTESMIPAEGSYIVGKSLTDWLKRKGVSEVIALEGLPFSAVSSEGKLFEFSTVPRETPRAGGTPVREGAISGLNACMLEECIEHGISWTSIFVPTSRLASMDYGASAEAVDAMNRLFKLGVDPTPLRRSDEAVKKATVDQQKQPSAFSKFLKK
jgi:predicted ATP-grasp superfamily ATP-dependent carboligase